MKLVVVTLAVALALAATAAVLAMKSGYPRPAESTVSSPREWRQVLVYPYDVKRDTGPDGNVHCSDAGLVPIRRIVPRTNDAAADAVRELLALELTGDERQAGLDSEFPLQGVTLASSSLVDGLQTLTFHDPYSRTGGGSCRVSILQAQVEATARQFPEVREVRILPEEAFQP